MPYKCPPKVIEATLKTLIACKGNRHEAARRLRISPSAIQNRLTHVDPKRIPPATGYAVAVPAGGGKVSEVYVRQQTLRHELAASTKRAERAEAALEKLRDARKITVAPKPRKPRGPEGDRIIVVRPDVHGCYQDPKAVAAYLADLKKLRPSEGIGLGDLVDCGGFLAQHHVLNYLAQADYSFEQDIEAGNRFLDAETEAAGGCAWAELEGNHEQRVEQWCITSALRSQKDAAFILKHFSPKVLMRMHDRGRTYVGRGESVDGLPNGTIRRGKLLLVHGHHVGSFSVGAALRTYRHSVLYGHTHRIESLITSNHDGSAIGAWTVGYLAQSRPYWQHGRPNGWAHGYAVIVLAKSGNFQVIQVPIVDGVSLLPHLALT